MSTPPTVDMILERAGGPRRVAEGCDVSGANLRKWRQKRTVPPRHWPTIVALSDGKVSFEDLAECAANANTIPAQRDALATDPSTQRQDEAAA